MRELLRSNDAVLLSWLSARFAAEGIRAHVFDTHASIMEGSISAIPRRVMVAEEDFLRAERILDEKGIVPVRNEEGGLP
ncbi:MAG: DUF2007 domain-containing protein [Rhodospirillales bacterium]|nr:DUF2007 domain-containing protein [Rhodospirillales bacterium]MCW8862374.1 DUF2007 domain-containing protein [Rhodospirillales bacterium]MCW8951821.1 DUF2007 domain-containing protein [Rhodospirillales bacterium]MCW8970994.1 DUF2007 domain-containing protein [Rhodospirillales bacterium]MCW9001395.1 DUF2007 domain-containing protein [Rhodospirillales bacterium]